jgi:hypothetical protein
VKTLTAKKEFRIALLILNLLVPITGFGLAFEHEAEARDLHGRFGLGYNSQFANANPTFEPFAAPALSFKYGATKNFHMQLIAGATTSNPVNAVVGAKFYGVIFNEPNMNFYGMFGGAFVAGGTTASGSRLGFDVLAGFGAEFFIPGVDSLGFSFETGARVENVTSGTVTVATMGVNILSAGVHFYF